MSVMKGGVMIAGATQCVPDLFDWKWADHKLNDVSWLRADTFSWQDGGVYEAAYDHLEADITGKSLQTETIAGTTISFYLADDGHKICPAAQESNVAAIYNATGEAWYYIIDTVNERFKLPRKHSTQIVRSVKNNDNTWYRLYADGWVEQGGLCSTTGSGGTNNTVTLPITMADTTFRPLVTRSSGASNTQSINYWSRLPTTTNTFVIYTSSGTDVYWEVAGMSAIDMSLFQGGHKYLYFFMGLFTKTAIENTAGVNSEIINDFSAHRVIAFQAPTSENNYTWYRKYADGWVEQGGTCAPEYHGTAVSFPTTMANTNYQFQLSVGQGQLTGTVGAVVDNRTTTGMTVYTNYSGGAPDYICWEVKGMAAV